MMHAESYSLKNFKEHRNKNNQYVQTPIDYGTFIKWNFIQSLQKKRKLIYINM